MSLSIDKLSIEKQDRDPEILALIGSPCSFSALSDNGTPLSLAFEVPLPQPVAFGAVKIVQLDALYFPLLVPFVCVLSHVHLPADSFQGFFFFFI